MAGKGGRAEAERWLGIAEKLLAAHDLQGSKTFAIRARESDPGLEGSDRILAVVDTLLASVVRINNQHDWYAVLQLTRPMRDPQRIATQYARLASLLAPTVNTFPLADHAFRLVSDAFTLLSNPSKKSLYDKELNLFSASTHDSQPIRAQHDKQPSVRRSPRTKGNQPVYESTPSSSEPAQTEVPSFWTACPYCYNLYEYPRVYEECTLRCQKCRRAFHAVAVPSPPGVGSGKDSYFCCWGFFPLGVSNWESTRNVNGVWNWAPFSSMFSCPLPAQGVEGTPDLNFAEENRNVPKPKNVNTTNKRVTRAVIDEEDDVSFEVSDPSEDSDDYWDGSRSTRKKKAKNARGKVSGGKSAKNLLSEKANKRVNQVRDGGDGSVRQEAVATEKAMKPDSGKKTVGGTSKRQTGKSAKELGKLDLNVEFSNEVEEPAPGMSGGNGTGNGEEDGMSGIAFFEGLDEFLSSLPILSVVVDEKVKAPQ